MRLRVLLVDDDACQRQAFKRLLTMRNVPTHDVASGSDAIAFVESELPTVIVLDEMMPDLSGRQTLAKLRTFPPPPRSRFISIPPPHPRRRTKSETSA